MSKKISAGENFNPMVQAMLVDRYQLSMLFAYWHNNRHEKKAVFELFFRKNPFRGEYTVTAGLGECLKLIQNYKFTSEDIKYLKGLHGYEHIPEEFWKYIESIDTKSIKLYAMDEGSVCFPNVPMLYLEGPIGILQILETPLLTLTNYASLVATQAARLKRAANYNRRKDSGCNLLEFGLRRAQGPDGGFSASMYAYIGGADATSNLLAGKRLNIPVSGTLGHSFIYSFVKCGDLSKENTKSHKFLYNKKTGCEENFTICCLKFEDQIKHDRANFQFCRFENKKSELEAFIAFVCAFPDSFSPVVDSYDVTKSGVINFCIVALALMEFGYKPIGVRIDSGDLAYLSRFTKGLFDVVSRVFSCDDFKNFQIYASNDINEEIINSLNDQEHYITSFGVGTHLVTCQEQPALGVVYKLVESDNIPCMKLSQVVEKTSIPGKKAVYRLYGREGFALVDYMTLVTEEEPQVGSRILCHHPSIPEKRVYVTPAKVECLLKCWWDGELTQPVPDLVSCRSKCKESLSLLTDDIKRRLNPTPYKVSISEQLWALVNKLKLDLCPIGELT